MSTNQCLPVAGKSMSKVKKIIEEARDLQTREIDLVDRNLRSFDEIPNICEWMNQNRENIQIWNKIFYAHLFTTFCWFLIFTQFLCFRILVVNLLFVTRLTLSHNKISGESN